MVRMILTDLDHTLLRHDGSVSENTLDIISECRKQGVKFAICTARYWIGTERYINMLSPDYEITTDGTLIHSNGECVFSSEFSEQTTNDIIKEILHIVSDAEITAACGKTVFWNSKRISESERLHKAVYCDYSSYLNVRANKIAAALPDERTSRDIAEKVRCRLQCYRGENLYGFLPKNAGKIAAIKALTEISGISLNETVAFGDDLNDIEMLKMCGIGAAVANAIPQVLEIADEVTLSNDEDGVAEWIKEHILEM